MKEEPIAILAGVGIVVTNLLHTYLPELDNQVVSAIGILVVALARQFVVSGGSAERIIKEWQDKLGKKEPKPKPRRPRPETSILGELE